MLVRNPPLESRPPRLWTVSVTCAALFLVATIAALTSSPQATAQSATGSASAVSPDHAQQSATSPSSAGGASGMSSPFTAKLPCGVVVELLGVSEHPSKENSWWRPNGSPLAEPPCEPLKGPVNAGQGDVVRVFALQWQNLPSDAVSTQVLFDPPYKAYAGDIPKRFGKNVAGLEAMTVSLPNQPTTTARVRVAAGLWTTVCESTQMRGFGRIRVRNGVGVAWSPVVETDGSVSVTVSEGINKSMSADKPGIVWSPVDKRGGNVTVFSDKGNKQVSNTISEEMVGPDFRVIAVGFDGREHYASRLARLPEVPFVRSRPRSLIFR